MATERIDIVVSERGSRVVRRNLEDIGRSASGSEGAVNLLRRALGLIGAGAAVQQLVQLTDTFTNLQNRIRTVTDTNGELALVTDELFKIANRTRASFEGTVEVYARTALAAKELGTSQQELLNFTESLNQAVILSGAGAQEANNTLIQLSQGIASGTLRGDELRSVLEQLPVVADVIAKSLGVTRGQLRLLGQEGKISAQDILTAFREAREELAIRFGETVPTIGQSFAVLRNQVIFLLGEFNNASGVATGFSTAILALANNLETVARVIGAVSVAVGIQFAVQAVGAAIRGLAALAAAALANPFTALFVAISAVIGVLVAFGDQLRLTADSNATVLDFLIAGFQTLVSGAQQALSFVLRLFGGVQDSIDDLDFLEIARGMARAMDALIIIVRAGIRVALNELQNFAARGGQVVADVINFITPGDDVVAPRFKDTGLKAGEAFRAGIQDALANGGGFLTNFVEQTAQGAERVARDRQNRLAAQAAEIAAARAGLSQSGPSLIPAPGTDKLNEIVRALEQETLLLGLNNKEREIRQALFQIEDKVGRELSDVERQRVQSLLEQNQALAIQADVLDEIRGPVQALADRRGALEDLFRTGQIGAEEFAKAMRELNVQATALDNTIGGGIANGFARLAQQADQLGQQVSDFVVGSFNQATEAIVNFAQTGELNIRQFFSDLFAQLARLALNQVFSQLASGLFGGAGGGGGGFFGSLLGGLFGGLPGFASGGSFEVGPGSSLATLSGQDNRLVAFRARDGEEVSVTPRGAAGRGAGGAVVQNFSNVYNITTPDADSFRRSQQQILARTDTSVRRAAVRNN